MPLGIKKNNSPWGAPDFASEDKQSTTSSYDWGGNSGTTNDFFSSELKGPKKVIILVSSFQSNLSSVVVTYSFKLSYYIIPYHISLDNRRHPGLHLPVIQAVVPKQSIRLQQVKRE